MQFKYGELDLYSYDIGDALAWRGDQYDEGVPGMAHVYIFAIAEPCRACGFEPEVDEYDIELRKDVVYGVSASAYSIDYDMEGWVVVQE
ncbi:hypothetical protein Ssi03_45160 [Sphaerisporangium siamense]|nr:hypothetical protein Ssi03_45160 [Sphaerisporangium siamense]